MTVRLSRRSLLQTTAALAAGAGVPAGPRPARAAEALTLRAERRTVEVKGKAASVFGLTQPSGTSGVFLDPEQRFLVNLVNGLDEPTIVHWHGQAPPAQPDGNPLTGAQTPTPPRAPPPP